MKSQPSAFGAYFEKQAGKRPLTNAQYYAAKKLRREIRFQLIQLDEDIAACDLWDVKNQYSLYAWMARDKK